MAHYIFILLSAAFVLSAGCGDGNETAQLDSLELDTITTPEPTMEGDLCVRLSAEEELVLDTVTVHLDSADGEEVARFSDFTVGPDGVRKCVMACICVDSSPLFLVAEADGETRTIDTGSSAEGCCESQ